MPNIKHWLFGFGPDKEIEFNEIVMEESNCSECIHKKVCKFSMEEFCINYKFGTSQHNGCQGCLHRFTRWDKDPIPCFKCKFFEKNTKI